MHARVLLSRAAAVTAALTLTATAAATGAAYAAPTGSEPGHGYYKGRVVSPIPLKVREETNTHSHIRGTLPPGTVRDDIVCKSEGEEVGGSWYKRGNRNWYLIFGEDDLLAGWVSARYVSNIGPAPRWCTDADVESAFGHD